MKGSQELGKGIDYSTGLSDPLGALIFRTLLSLPWDLYLHFVHGPSSCPKYTTAVSVSRPISHCSLWDPSPGSLLAALGLATGPVTSPDCPPCSDPNWWCPSGRAWPAPWYQGGSCLLLLPDRDIKILCMEANWTTVPFVYAQHKQIQRLIFLHKIKHWNTLWTAWMQTLVYVTSHLLSLRP